ncbi:MAG: sulfite exporter TauE/SafE family protein [Eggerthellaceae bacterium]|nr:sulfite exporter TauE/SafE family protein [Eggerthellaceae bacterium]
MSWIALFIIALAIGLLVGILSGLLGIGGGTLLVPTFKLCFSMASIACTATSLFTIVFTSISGTISHLRNKTCIPALGIACGIGGACTSPLGVFLATLSPEWLIMVVAAAVIVYASITMLQKGFALPKPEKGSLRAHIRDMRQGRKEEKAGNGPAEYVPDIPKMGAGQIVFGVLIGLVAGVASGYVGVGGGFIMVPMIIQFIHAPMKLISGTSLLAVMILSIPGVIYQAILGNIVWIAGIAVAIGSIPGAVIGAKLVPWLPERFLRLMFGFFLIFIAVVLIAEQLGLF